MPLFGSKGPSVLPVKIPKFGAGPREVESWRRDLSRGVLFTFKDTVITTDNTLTAFGIFQLSLNTIYGFTGHVTARRTTGSGSANDAGAWMIYAGVQNIAGTATLMTTWTGGTQPHAVKDVAGWNCTFEVLDDKLFVQADGAVTTTISWACSIKVITEPFF